MSSTGDTKDHKSKNLGKARGFSAVDAVDAIEAKLGPNYRDFEIACDRNNDEYKDYLDDFNYNNKQMMMIKYEVLARKEAKSKQIGM